MNLKRLEYFITLVQTKNLSRAAELLHISPPALSKAMKVLEEECEIKLFTKEGRNLILSDAGRNLAKRAPQLIEDLQLLKESLQTDATRAKAIRLGTFEVFSTYFLEFLKQLDWKQQALELHELLPGEIERAVSEGVLDFGITYMPIPHPDLDFLKVKAIEMGVFTKAGAFKDVPQPDLPFVVPVMPLSGVPTKARGLDGWPEKAYRRKVLHQVTLMESALELCRQGRVAGYFPAFVVHEHNKRVKTEYQLERQRLSGGRICRSDVYIVKRKATLESAVIKQLAKAIRVICV